MKELEQAQMIAEKFLNRPWADPDDDLAILARQFLRARERDERQLHIQCPKCGFPEMKIVPPIGVKYRQR